MEDGQIDASSFVEGILEISACGDWEHRTMDRFGRMLHYATCLVSVPSVAHVDVDDEVWIIRRYNLCPHALVRRLLSVPLKPFAHTISM